MFGSQINLLIVEDNDFHAEILYRKLRKFQYINIVGTVSTGKDLVDTVTTNSNIQALLLDIDLGEGRNGLESYSILRLRGIDMPAILITGAVPEASISYDLGIIDIIEKPYTETRFNQAIEKLRYHINYRNFVEEGGIFIPVVDETIVQVSPSEVLFIESVNRCVFVHTTNATLETKISLKAYEAYLNEHHFLMTHRSYLVNLKKIDRIDKETIYFINDCRTALIIEDKTKEVKYCIKNITMQQM